MDQKDQQSGAEITASERDMLPARLAALVEDSDDAILSKTLKGVITTWNRGATRIFGYTAEEAIGQPVTMLLPADRQDEEVAILDKLQRGERIDHFETKRRRKDGTIIDISLTVSPIKDATGKVIGASKIARDITETKRARNELREIAIVTESLNEVAKALATELDLAKVVQIITDAGTRIARAQFGAFFYNVRDQQGESYMLYSLSGVPKEAFSKFPMPRATEIFGPTFRGEGPVRLGDVRKDPRFGHNAPYHGMPQGHLPVVSYLAVPVVSRSGTVLGGLFFGHQLPDQFTARDETIIVGVAAQAAAAMDNARLYQAEQLARADAERANRAKDHFLATLSHELRTPLTPVLALISDLAVDPAMPTRCAEALETVRRNVELEARLIDDLLDLTRITQGKLELHREPLTIDVLIESALATCAHEIEAKKLSVHRKLSTAGHSFTGDGARLTQILWNLLKNAIKFTPQGGSVSIASWVEAGQSEKFLVEVADTGIGMERDMVDSLFKAFEQGGREITQQYGGLGLGLAISKAIAEAHGGTILARSEGRGKGSVFTLVLPAVGAAKPPAAEVPLRRAPAHGAPEGNERRGKPARLLFVEDHADTGKVIARILEADGYQVVRAASVAEAKTVAEREMAGQGIDLVVSDLGLPDGSGLELMRELADRFGLKGIALSGYGMESDLQASAAAGFVHHLIKPIKSNQLRQALADYFRQK